MPLFVLRTAVPSGSKCGFGLVRHSRTISSSGATAKSVASSLKNYGETTAQPEGQNQVLRMLMFGKPGAGKGTLSSRLIEKYDINFLSTGDLLRQHISEGTEVGRIAEEIVASGGLVPDDIMIRVISSKLDELRGKPWILDGFPRTLVQGELLDKQLKQAGSPLSMVINLEVPDEVILGRITDRWVHLPSGRVYNLSYNKPKVPGVDDITGEPLSKRPDDNPEVFSRRLRAFYDMTSPLLSYYTDKSSQPISTSDPHTSRTKLQPLKMLTLTGRTSDEIWPKLESVVTQNFKVRSKTSAASATDDVVAAETRIEGKRMGANIPA